tara:strand:+ start:3792 stop:4184 length:393 start_codon:yes stop_codon:yes gene_type:complete
MVQKKIWEEEIPEWLKILDRLDEVNSEDADANFIKDIDEDFNEILVVDEAKKFVYYWSGKRKLKTNRKGSWKLGWKNWLNKALRQKKYYERSKERPTENTKTSEYQRSKEYLKEVSRKRAERHRRRYGNN